MTNDKYFNPTFGAGKKTESGLNLGASGRAPRNNILHQVVITVGRRQYARGCFVAMVT